MFWLKIFVLLLMCCSVRNIIYTDGFWTEKISGNVSEIKKCYDTFLGTSKIYNKYQVEAKVLVLRDKDGKDLNKRTTEKYAIHGIWPEDVCINNERLNMEKLTTKEVLRIKYLLSDLLLLKHVQEYTSQFLWNEYYRHWYKNEYKVEKMIQKYTEFNNELEHKGVKSFYVHDCRFNWGYNIIQQLVKLEEKTDNLNLYSSCRTGRHFEFPEGNYTYPWNDGINGRINYENGTGDGIIDAVKSYIVEKIDENIGLFIYTGYLKVNKFLLLYCYILEV